MKRFLKNLFSTILLWLLVAVCLFNLPYSNYVENVLSFWGIFMLLISIICIVTATRMGKSLSQDSSYKPAGKFYKSYRLFTTVVEVGVFAAMGWYWVAAGVLLFSIAIFTVFNEADKHYVPTH